MPTQTQNMRQKIANCESFDDLYYTLGLTPNILVYSEEVLERIQNLPIAINSDFIWMLVRYGYSENSSGSMANCETYQNFLEIYCNRIVAEGLLGSDTTATWETLIGKPEGTNVIPLIVVITTVDRSNIDLKYLAETAHAITNYDYSAAHDVNFECDDVAFILRDIFCNNGQTLFGRAEKNSESSPVGSIHHNIMLELSNVITNREAKFDFIGRQLKDWSLDQRNEKIQTVARNLGFKYGKEYHGILSEEDYTAWVTYFMASFMQILEKWQSKSIMPSDPRVVQKEIATQYVQSSEIVLGQIPDPVNLEDLPKKYRLLNDLMEQGLYLTKVCDMVTTDVEREYFPFTLMLKWTDDGKMNYPEGYHPNPPDSLALEAKSLRDRRPEPEDEEEPEEDEEEDYDDADARRYNRGKNAKQTKSHYAKSSGMVDRAGRKIYRGYRAYKDAEAKVDSQVSKLTMAVKNKYRQGIRDEIVEGKQFSVVRILKKIMTTAAVFSYGKIAGLLFVIVRRFTHNKVSNKERYEIMQELQLEIKMLEEKIEDARGDGNRQAKYSMMRTKAELEKAYNQIRYGMKSNRSAKAVASKLTRGKLNLDYNGPGGDE